MESPAPTREHVRGIRWPTSVKASARRPLRVLGIALGVMLALAIVLRLVLDPIVEWQTRKALADIDGYQGDFKRIHVTLLKPGVEITQFKMSEKNSKGVVAREPLVYAARIQAVIAWSEIVRGRLLARLRIEEPKFTIVQVATAPKPKEKPAVAPDVSAQLEQVLGMRVDRIEILDGELLFRENSGERPQELWIHRLEIAVQNLATRKDLAGGRPTTMAGRGQVGRSGDLTWFVSADPFASPLSFAGQVSMTGLKAAELYGFLEPKVHLQATQGTIDFFAEFVSKDGWINGGVKPVLKNIEIRPTDSKVWNRLKAWMADKTVEFASDRVPGRNAIATTIPIKGKLTEPEVQLWPTILGVIRNSFVQGVTSGFSNLPPETADKSEGALSQAAKALKKKEGPPKAQPAEAEPPEAQPVKGD